MTKTINQMIKRGAPGPMPRNKPDCLAWLKANNVYKEPE